MKAQKWILVLLLLAPFSSALVLETDSMLSILSYLLQDSCKNRNKLVIFDIDDTLIAPTAESNSTRWVEYMAKKIMVEENIPFDQAWQQAGDLNDSILETLLLKPVEEITPALIKALQQAGIPVIALTARPKRSISRTQLQLQMIGIDFSLSQVIPMIEIELSKKNKTWYEKGIIYSASSNKGATLMSFLKSIDCSPKQIIFIDDNKKRVEEVEQALRENGLNAIIFHYTYVQSKNPHLFKENNAH
jgi:phosphoserine phosphatase